MLEKAYLCSIVLSSKSFLRSPELVQYRIVDHSELDLLVHHEAEDGAELRVAADEVGGAVYRVDDPGLLGGQGALGARRHALLADELGGGEPGGQPRDQQLLHLLVSLRHQVVVGALLADNKVFGCNLERHPDNYLIFFSE